MIKKKCEESRYQTKDRSIIIIPPTRPNLTAIGMTTDHAIIFSVAEGVLVKVSKEGSAHKFAVVNRSVSLRIATHS